MDITKLVESIDGAEHLCNIESSMTIGKDTSIVEQSSEISTGDIFLQKC
jgi:hypothetical protein